MPTVVNTPVSQSDTTSGIGFLAGMIAIILFVIFLLYVLVPMLRNASRSPQVKVPEKIEAQVNQ